MKRLLVITILPILFLSISCSFCLCQTSEPTQFNNIFGAGASYDNISKPGITASIIEAKLLTSQTSTSPAYSFSVIDVSPVKNADSKITWQTSVTTGIATILRRLGPLGNTWIVGTIGGATQGERSGLAWSAGAAWTKPISQSGLILMADIRTLKVVNNDYQARIGFKLCFGTK
jgi:hypothetical protein